MEKIKEFFTQNKKIIIPATIILVLLIAICIYFVSQPSDNANKKAENQTEDKVDVSQDKKDDAKVDETPVETPADKPTSAPADKPAVDKPASNGNTSASNGGGSVNKPASKPSTPSHTHTWKNHTATKQVWVSNIVPVYETQRVQVGTKKVSDGIFWHCNCGAVIPANEQEAHSVAHILAGEPDNGYHQEHFHNEPVYEDKQVQVGTRDDGHYETQSYTDYQYCDCGAKK